MFIKLIQILSDKTTANIIVNTNHIIYLRESGVNTDIFLKDRGFITVDKEYFILSNILE